MNYQNYNHFTYFFEMFDSMNIDTFCETPFTLHQSKTPKPQTDEMKYTQKCIFYYNLYKIYDFRRQKVALLYKFL